MFGNSLRKLTMAGGANFIAVFLVVTGTAHADHYVLILGVNSDAQAMAKKDAYVVEAQEVGKTFYSQSRKLPGKTWRCEILGARASRPAILKGLAWLSRMRASDTAFVYICTHGSGSALGFTICPMGYEGKRWQETGVSGKELHEAMARLAGPSVLCVTACYSGWLLEQPGTWGKCLPIVSCASNETSSLGVMGLAVVEALDGTADANRDGTVTGKEFWTYVIAR